MTYDTWKTTPPADDEPDVEACGHRVGTCEGECRLEALAMAAGIRSGGRSMVGFRQLLEPERAQSLAAECPGCGASADDCANYPPTAIKCCPDCSHRRADTEPAPALEEESEMHASVIMAAKADLVSFHPEFTTTARGAEFIARLVDSARRDWDVRVLDALSSGAPGRSWRVTHHTGEWSVMFPAHIAREGNTPDAARHAAALAAWDSLSTEEKAGIGECP